MSSTRPPSRGLIVCSDGLEHWGGVDALRGREALKNLPLATWPLCGDPRRAVERVGDVDDLFALSADPEATQRVVDLLGEQWGERLHPIALLGDRGQASQYEQDGAVFFCEGLGEAAALVGLPWRDARLSVVLLAFNEEDSIERAIADARRFAKLAFSLYEIVVVDDGSQDSTRARAEACSQGDVRLVVHARNRGMGASMRDGFAAAEGDFVAPFPADRQVRPQALAPFLPLLGPRTAVVGYYETPHAGGARRVLSAGFAELRRHVGGLRIPYDGTYLFPRRFLARVDSRLTASTSFVYSYELLEQLARLDCELKHVPVRPFLREHGESRVAKPTRVLRVAGEIFGSRKRAVGTGLKDRLGRGWGRDKGRGR